MRPFASVSAIAVSLVFGGVARADDAPAAAPLTFTSTGREQTISVARLGESVGAERPAERTSEPVATCTTPCALQVAPGIYDYRAGGRRLRTYLGQVDVPPRGRVVRLRGASKPGFVAGVILTGVGAATTALMGALAGAILISGTDDSYNHFMAGMAGGSILVLGLPTLITGIALVTSNAKVPVE